MVPDIDLDSLNSPEKETDLIPNNKNTDLNSNYNNNNNMNNGVMGRKRRKLPKIPDNKKRK